MKDQEHKAPLKFIKMNIIDLNGDTVIVTNLQVQIYRAARLKKFCMQDPEYSKKGNPVRLYYEDLHRKLLKLRRAVEKLKQKTMAIISEKTDPQALLIIAEIFKLFGGLEDQKMTAQDDKDAVKSRNLLQRIIETNGYRLNNKGKLTNRF